MSDKVNVPMGTTRAGITNFEHWDLIPIKQMVANSRPDRLQEVADHWMSVKAELDAASQELKAATDHITAHWEGSAAQGFVERSSVLQESITNTGAHAENTSHAMTYAGQALQVAKTDMASIDVPSDWEKAKDKVGDLGHRDDTQFRADIAAGMDRDTAVAKNAGSLSITEERHQQAIAVMERLAPQYNSATTVMQQPVGSVHHPKRPLPPPPKKIVEPSQVGPTPKSPRTSTGTTNPSHQQVGTHPTYQDPRSISDGGKSRDDGISTNPTHAGTVPTGTTPPSDTHPFLPNGPAHTGIDSTGGGSSTSTQSPPGGIGSGTGGGSGSGYGGGGGGGGSIGLGGGYGGGGYGGGTTGGRMGIGGAAAEEGRAGAGGMGGMPGMGGAGRGGAASRGGSSLARRAGGAIGAGGKRAGGAFTEGGSGLGRNRGSGAAGGRGGGAVPGAGGAGRKKDKKGGSTRPDYLVEDEDTWTNGGGPVNPPVIE